MSEVTDAPRTFFLVAAAALRFRVEMQGWRDRGRRPPRRRADVDSIFDLLSRERGYAECCCCQNNANCSTPSEFRWPRHSTLLTVLFCDMCLCLQRARLNAVRRVRHAVANCRERESQSSRLTRTPSKYIQALRHSSETAAR